MSTFNFLISSLLDDLCDSFIHPLFLILVPVALLPSFILLCLTNSEATILRPLFITDFLSRVQRFSCMTGLICTATWELFPAELVNDIQVTANKSHRFILFKGRHAQTEAKICAFHVYGKRSEQGAGDCEQAGNCPLSPTGIYHKDQYMDWIRNALHLDLITETFILA